MTRPALVLRRRRALTHSAGLLLGLFAAACKAAEPASCTNTAGLTPEDTRLRTTLAYSDRAPDSARLCDACIQYIEAAQAGTCGGCKLMNGPVHPKGTCNVFAPKV